MASRRAVRVAAATCNFAVRANIVLVFFSRDGLWFVLGQKMADAKDKPVDYRRVMKDKFEDYYPINAAADRRRATNFRAPALTWHRAFWLQAPYERGATPKTEGQLKQDRDCKKKTIDSIIELIWTFIHRQSQNKCSGFGIPKCHPTIRHTDPAERDVHLLFAKAVIPESSDKIVLRTIDENELNQNQRAKDVLKADNRVVSLNYSWHGTTITIRTELHEEYFTLTVFVEFPDTVSDLPIDVLKGHYKKLRAYFGDQSNADKSLPWFLFREFWQDHYLKPFSQDKDVEKALDNKIFHHMFADFRGLVICDDTYKITPDVSQKPTRARGDKLKWGMQIEKKCRRLFANHDRYECTGSYMLDQRAAYFTMFAPQSPEVIPDELIPLEYVLYVHQKYYLDADNKGVNEWQLGRLADRIHLLGTVRLASLKYLPALREAGTTLSHLDAYVKAAREAINPEQEEEEPDESEERSDNGSVEEGSKERDSEERPTEGGEPTQAKLDQEGRTKPAETRTTVNGNDGESAIGFIKKAHSIFGKISRDFNENTKTNTGILYRIEQSRYYTEEFNKNVKALRLTRLEGYQRYDQFVERRLGPVFDFIDRLGRRYERATNTLSLLDQFYLSIRSNEIDQEVRNIQQIGEAALWGVLVPYYLVSLLTHIVAHQYMKNFTVGVWIAFFSIATGRFGTLMQGKSKNAIYKMTWGILCGILGGVLLGVSLLLLWRWSLLSEAFPDFAE